MLYIGTTEHTANQSSTTVNNMQLLLTIILYTETLTIIITRVAGGESPSSTVLHGVLSTTSHILTVLVVRCAIYPLIS